MISIRRSCCRFRFYFRFCSTSSSDSAKQQTHFGFETVDENAKSQKVYDVFENVASRYDLMNDVMSFGIHRFWKDRFVERLNPSANIRLLDVAGGTGDIAFRVLRHNEYKSKRNKLSNGESSHSDRFDQNAYTISSPLIDDDATKAKVKDEPKPKENETTSIVGGSVTVCDINQAMLDVGRKRAEDMGINEGITWVRGDAETLPFENDQFDAYTIAFGIRNCTHIDKVLQEAHRVLRRGGRFMCLEFSEVRVPVINSIYDWYSFQVIPVMGQIFAADWKSYQYLVESIRQFPNQKDYANMIRKAGFRAVTYENLSCGVVAIHSGFKL